MSCCMDTGGAKHLAQVPELSSKPKEEHASSVKVVSWAVFFGSGSYALSLCPVLQLLNKL